MSSVDELRSRSMKKNKFIYGLFLIFGISIIAAGVYFMNVESLSRDQAFNELLPNDSHTVQIGARLYTQYCAVCHGPVGEGQANWREPGPNGLRPAPPHDDSGHTWHHADAQLFAITKHGLAKLIEQPDYQTSMPIYEGVLSDDEIVAVLSWIKAQWSPEIQARHDKVNKQYQNSLKR